MFWIFNNFTSTEYVLFFRVAPLVWAALVMPFAFQRIHFMLFILLISPTIIGLAVTDMAFLDYPNEYISQSGSKYKISSYVKDGFNLYYKDKTIKISCEDNRSFRSCLDNALDNINYVYEKHTEK